jgi:hypothetical protein
VVQNEILDEIKDENLRVHVVWTPVLEDDDRNASLESRNLIPDRRALHYWDEDLDLGLAYGRTVELPPGRDLAWDIYFVFDQGTKWEQVLPTPVEFSHQLGRGPRYLGDGSRLRDLVREALDRAQ